MTINTQKEVKMDIINHMFN